MKPRTVWKKSGHKTIVAPAQSVESPSTEQTGHTPQHRGKSPITITILPMIRGNCSKDGLHERTVAILVRKNGRFNMADANLICAAPALLEAAKQAIPDWIPDADDLGGHICCELTNNDVRALRAAIELATRTPKD